LGDKIEKNGMGRACSECGLGERRIQAFLGNLRESDHLGDPYVDGTIILRWIFRKWYMGVWIGSNWLSTGTGGWQL